MDPSGASWENNVDWTTDDELEVFGDVPFQASSSLTNNNEESIGSPLTENSSNILEKDETLSILVDMGYTMGEALIAMDKCGSDAQIRELIDFIHGAQIEKDIDSRLQHSPNINKKNNVAVHTYEKEKRICWATEKSAAAIDEEENISCMLEKDETLSMLVDMGYAMEEVLIAIDNCGLNAQISELIDFICAARIEKEIDSQNQDSHNQKPNVVVHAFEEENTFMLEKMLEKDETLSTLVDMGYTMEEALTAVDIYGLDAEISELTDFICAARIEKEIDSQLQNSNNKKHHIVVHTNEKSRYLYNNTSKRVKLGNEKWKSRIYWASKKKAAAICEEVTHLPNPMIGFGTPDEWCPMVERKLPEIVAGPPYFYYENVAFTPKGVWSKISRFLYEVEPEFVDSKFFCAATRKRGYIHNLPIRNRYLPDPLQPLTIKEALPSTSKWWPSWDKRTKLNCIQTCIASAKLTERIRKKLEDSDDEPLPDVQDCVLKECKKWNLVWVGKNKVAPLEPDELEMLMGFPRHHTRGGGISRTDRYKALGNAFQVDTVAYHLSVLKDRFPNGMNILSLFSGIGGAEVALHRVGITLKNVVSVEISEVNRNIVRSWWEQTNQTGNLIEVEDVQKVGADKLEMWMTSFGGFDLIIGGSPCNNLTGSNRVSRDGLEGKDSSLFYEYYRVLDQLKTLMRG